MRAHIILYVAAMALLGGCASPTRGLPDGAAVATTLVPVRHAGVQDRRGEFRLAFCEAMAQLPDEDGRSCDSLLHRLNDETPAARTPPPLKVSAKAPLVFVPGIFGECVRSFTTPFSDDYKRLRELGYAVHAVELDGRSGSAKNADDLYVQLAAIHKQADQKAVLVTYSKGTPDTLEMFARHPDAVGMVRAMVSVAGVVSGTPIADGARGLYDKVFADISPGFCPAGDGQGVDSLTRVQRLQWLATNALPTLRFYSLTGYATDAMTSAPLLPFKAVLDRYDVRSDGQVMFSDAVIPGSSLLGFANADHWAIALPFNGAPGPVRLAVNRNTFPRAALIEAALRIVEGDEKK